MHGASKGHVASDGDRDKEESDGGPRQALFLRRHAIAVSTSLMVVGLVVAVYLQGGLSARAALIGVGAILAYICAFSAIFWSGLNKRFRDPSLTLPQIIAAWSVVLGLMYATTTSRALFQQLLLMAFLFGVLRFDRRELLRLAAGILVAHAALIAVLRIGRPDQLDLATEIVQWLALALVLFWFAWMGGYIRNLRRQLRQRNVELTQALRAARESEANLAEAQRIARIGMWVVDPKTRTTTWSRETFELFGRDERDGVPPGRSILSLVHPEDVQRYLSLIRPALLEARGFDSEFRVLLPDGKVRWLHAIGRPELDQSGQTVLVRGTLRDVTAQREADEHIRQLAHYDTLTGLANRSLFGELLGRSLAQSQRRGTLVGLLFIDLDGFKGVNDQFGHAAGDALIAAFAARLRATLRRSDAAGRFSGRDGAARLGGDEFAVLIDDFSRPEQLGVVAARILAAVATPFELEGVIAGAPPVVTIGASIGIAIAPWDGTTVDDLVREADAAMYRAKRGGKNGYRFAREGSDPPVLRTA